MEQDDAFIYWGFYQVNIPLITGNWPGIAGIILNFNLSDIHVKFLLHNIKFFEDDHALLTLRLKCFGAVCDSDRTNNCPTLANLTIGCQIIKHLHFKNLSHKVYHNFTCFWTFLWSPYGQLNSFITWPMTSNSSLSGRWKRVNDISITCLIYTNSIFKWLYFWFFCVSFIENWMHLIFGFQNLVESQGHVFFSEISLIMIFVYLGDIDIF